LLDEIISELVQRRRCLQAIADATSVVINFPQKATGLLHSQAQEVHFLENQHVVIHRYRALDQC